MRKWLCLLLICCFMPLSALAEMPEWMATEDAYPRYVQVPGRGEMRYYAQNEPLWGKMSFRYPHYQAPMYFSSTGCVPTALANCIANLVSREKLTVLREHAAEKDFFICPCSMNLVECNRTHARYPLTTTADFDRFLCLAIGSYISGNNPEGEYACGTLAMLDELMEIYGLRYQKLDDLKQAAEIVQKERALAIFLVGGEDCPFTASGHALVLCHADENEYYFLDSYFRLEYELDKLRLLRIVEPGLAAMKNDKVSCLGANSIYVIFPEEG